MKEKISLLYKKYQSFVLYALYGVPPTILNFGGYVFFVRECQMDAAMSNLLSWTMALVLSFFLYRRFVFKSPSVPLREMGMEFVKFFGVRAGTGFFETSFVWLFVSRLGFHAYVFKVLASLFSILINYLVSKLCIFEQQEEKNA
jgi:putative flippase GtrA